jgi:cation-transporting ATPase 13A2
VECDLIFLGLLVMQNTLKPETTPVIRLLHNANIRTVMITGRSNFHSRPLPNGVISGDNILTAISVARDCEMVKTNDQIFVVEVKQKDCCAPELVYQSIGSASVPTGCPSSGCLSLDCSLSVCFASLFRTVLIGQLQHQHLAIDGKTWTQIKAFYPDLLPSLLVRTTVFARFQPDQKTQLVTYMQSLDYVVSMVGDGANDCGALKAAHVGVSLSQAEASVAAPFTSAIQDISCIVHLILEGRCALVTSFAVFKYMALYSLIQFTTVLILYKVRTDRKLDNLTNRDLSTTRFCPTPNSSLSIW